MPSPIYAKVLEAVSTYVPQEKAAGIVDRQLPKCNSTADNLNRAGLDQVMTWLLGAANLYISDAAAREALKSRLQAIR